MAALVDLQSAEEIRECSLAFELGEEWSNDPEYRAFANQVFANKDLNKLIAAERTMLAPNAVKIHGPSVSWKQRIVSAQVHYLCLLSTDLSEF